MGPPIGCDWILGRQHIIDTTDWRVVRRSLHQFRVSLGFLRNLVHHVDERVDSLLALVLGRLYHETLVEEQREINRRSMVSVVEQALGNVHCCHACALVCESVEDHFVLAKTLDGQEVIALQAFLDIVRIEGCRRPYLLDVLASELQDVGISLEHHTEIAKEVADRAEWFLCKTLTTPVNDEAFPFCRTVLREVVINDNLLDARCRQELL